MKLVYSILGQAVGEGASDVHFEPGEGEMRVRFRIDGVLREAARVPNRMVTRSSPDEDHERPQHRRETRPAGRPRQRHRRGTPHRPAVTTLPTQRGEGATIRILDKDNAQRSLDDLGMDGSARERFENSFHQAYGAVLVTGPTGSGKSTTLYAALQELNEVGGTSSRSRIRSSIASTGSARSTSTARPASTSPPDCARCCVPTRHRHGR